MQIATHAWPYFPRQGSSDGDGCVQSKNEWKDRADKLSLFDDDDSEPYSKLSPMHSIGNRYVSR